MTVFEKGYTILYISATKITSAHCVASSTTVDKQLQTNLGCYLSHARYTSQGLFPFLRLTLHTTTGV